MLRRVSIIAALAVIAGSVVIAVGAAASTRPARPATVSAPAAPAGSQLAADVLAARQATAKYATNLARARADGYRIITRMIPYMGYHFMNPSVTSFDVRRPPILVYEHRGRAWQLGALEWVFTSMPSKPPLPGASYGVFGAACHYVDGTFVFADAQSKCASKSPQTGAAFSFWHPRLITLHFWVWYPNPAGLYMGTNALAVPFNAG
ncbi:MAG TPA: hypothetical protein VKT31_12015 [Solirubrobacteraceae bacterium]|nr:hypothetical protein [Solirubrobacteraceae bacterium]